MLTIGHRGARGYIAENTIESIQKALDLNVDGIEIDVPHASVVPHVIFQYNPPYTIPILRRNEIGIPVRLEAKAEEDDTAQLAENWAEDSSEEVEGEEVENSEV